MIQALRSLFTPLLCLIILTLGNSLVTTYYSLRLHDLGSDSFIVGALSTAYYGGMLLAAFKSGEFIFRVGHIRAYAAFASTLAVATMMHGLYINGIFWIFLRLIDGIAIGGLYVVIESWILANSHNENRGQILAIYMVALYIAQALGQFLLNIGQLDSLVPYAIATIFASLSVIPLAMTKTPSPEFDEPSTLSVTRLFQTSPSGVITCTVSGLILGCIYGLLPIYLTDSGYSVRQLSFLMGITIFGGMLLQYPIGKLSDIIKRRTVISALGVFSAIIAILMLIMAPYYSIFSGLLFLFGGLTFTMYPVGISHTCDRVESKDIVSATQGLLLAYSLGAMIGPVIAPIFISIFGSSGLMIYFVLLSILLGVFAAWRKTQTEAPLEEDKQDFAAAMPLTPVAVELDPRAEEDNLDNTQNN